MKENVRNLEVVFEDAPAIAIEPITRFVPAPPARISQPRAREIWKWSRLLSP
jgi:hypothetical protein